MEERNKKVYYKTNEHEKTFKKRSIMEFYE